MTAASDHADPDDRPPGPLRRGWTTGTCAAAAARAAFEALLGVPVADPVPVTLPNGTRPHFALARLDRGADAATAGVVKDAGDDPDVTHGALVLATVRHGAAGVTFRAGEGVGTVTLPGLPLGVGEPAINPVPRRMIAAALAEVAAAAGVPCHVEVTVGVEDGRRLAERTMNGRLGILGGLSILGTTGIVVPYSCAAWIASIHRGIDVARAAGLGHVAGATGRTSEEAVRKLYDLPEAALIDMGDFAGGMLKYLGKHPVARVTVAGGFAKISKLAEGRLDLHSKRGAVDMDGLARRFAQAGGRDPDRIAAANTAMAALAVAAAEGVPLADLVAAEARAVACRAVGNAAVAVDVVVFDRAGLPVGRAWPDGAAGDRRA